MENQDNVTMKTSLNLCTSVQCYPPSHTHEASSPGDYYIISYTIYKLMKLLQSFNMDRFNLVSLFKQMCPTDQIQFKKLLLLKRDELTEWAILFISTEVKQFTAKPWFHV